MKKIFICIAVLGAANAYADYNVGEWYSDLDACENGCQANYCCAYKCPVGWNADGDTCKRDAEWGGYNEYARRYTKVVYGTCSTSRWASYRCTSGVPTGQEASEMCWHRINGAWTEEWY